MHTRGALVDCSRLGSTLRSNTSYPCCATPNWTLHHAFVPPSLDTPTTTYHTTHIRHSDPETTPIPRPPKIAAISPDLTVATSRSSARTSSAEDAPPPTHHRRRSSASPVNGLRISLDRGGRASSSQSDAHSGKKGSRLQPSQLSPIPGMC